MAVAVQALLLLAAAYFAHQAYNLYKNIQFAKSTGLKYTISPINQNSTPYRIAHEFLKPLLPKYIMDNYAEIGGFNHWWTTKRQTFEKYGDLFLQVSPGRTMVDVADADVAFEVTQRRNDFPKPLEQYKILDIYGRNVVTTEGKEWRMHRKITGPPFSERINKLIWQESLRQADECIKAWNDPVATTFLTKSKSTQMITNLSQDFMRVSLLVISCAGFGRILSWPAPGSGQFNEANLPTGHTMSYQKALTLLIEHSLTIIIAPHWFLRHSWNEKHREAITAYDEFHQYMLEMYHEKKHQIAHNETLEDGERSDLMDALIRSSSEGEKLNLADGKRKGGEHATLTRDEILGNSFVFILAGHETTASTMQYASIYLALHPEIQTKIQAEIDAFMASDDPTYEDDFPLLEYGWVGALMFETLRLYQPVVAIPKSSVTPQTVTYQGRQLTLPGPSVMELNALNIHRNTKYWQAPGFPDSDPHTFRPERWFASPEMANLTPEQARATGSDRLRKPVKGSFLAFSEGFRACLGKKFAIVEVVAVMARLLKDHSFELPVDETKGETWESVHEEVRRKMKNCATLITLKLVEKIDLAFVKRGEERWRGKSGAGTFVPY